MKKQRSLISSAGHVVGLESDDVGIMDTIRDSGFLRRYIPDYSFFDNQLDDSSVPCLTVAMGTRLFEMSYPTATYQDAKPDEKDIVSILEMMLERGRQESGIYCLHSSSAVVNGSGVIFWGGASGMGKTTLSLLFGNVGGCNSYSDEKTLVKADSMEMVGGVKTVHITKGEVSKKFGLGFRQIDDEKAKHAPLKMLVQPQVVPGAKLRIEEWNQQKTEWHMYEELTRKIRGTSRRLFGNTLPVQSIDSDELARRRSVDSHLIASSVRSYFMRGDAEVVKKAILDMLV